MTSVTIIIITIIITILEPQRQPELLSVNLTRLMLIKPLKHLLICCNLRLFDVGVVVVTDNSKTWD